MRINQPSAVPTEKVAASLYTGAIVSILVQIAKEFGYELPVEAANAIVVLASFGVAYFTKNKAVESGRNS